MKKQISALLCAAILLSALPPGFCAPGAGSRGLRMEPLRVESRHQLGDALAAVSVDGAELDDHQLAALAVKSARILEPHEFSGLIDFTAEGDARVAGLHRAHPETVIDFQRVSLGDWKDGLTRSEIAAAEGLAKTLAGVAGIDERARLLRAFFENGYRAGAGEVDAGPAHIGGASPLAFSRSGADEARREPPSPDLKRETPSRIPSLDAARGLAILSMIPRNLGGVLLVGVANPTWFTAAGAIVPALFLLINGFVIAYSTKKDNPFWYYALRGLRVALVSGLVLDGMIWHIVPMTWVDILTTVGLVIPMIFWVRKLSPKWQMAAAIAAFAASFPLRYFLGYTMELAENDLAVNFLEPFAWAASFFLGNEILKRYVLKAKTVVSSAKRGWAILATALLFIIPVIRAFTLPETLAELAKGGTLSHFLVDGWFPLFPWIGFAILGSYLATRFVAFFKHNDAKTAHALAADFFKGVLKAGLVLGALGLASWIFLTPEVVTRMGYTIPIFPPTWQYLLAATGGIFTVVGGFYTMRNHPWVQKPYALLQTMGRRSLEIYVLHELIGQLIVFNGLKALGWSTVLGWTAFTGVSIATILACYAAAYYLEKKKFAPWL